jgi:CHAT domain-containing protein
MQTEKWARAAKPLRRALSLAEDLGDLDLQRRILRAQGRLYELRSDWSTAEEYYRQGVAVIEAYRESLAATQWSSMAFAQWRDVHRGLVRTLLAQNRPREALTALDRSRARHLQDLRTQARVANQLAPAARARLDSVSRVLSDVRTRLGTDTLSTAAETDLRTRETTLIADRQDLLQIDSSVADRPTIETVSARLDEQDRALVSYFLDDPWSVYDRPPRSTAFVLTADTLRTLSLPHLTQDSVRATVTATSSLFAEPRASERPGAMHFDLQPLRQLHDQLYAPVDEHLAPGQPLTVIPDGPLFHVPFSMLVSATPGGRYDHSQARFVLHDRPTALELATSMTGERPDPAFDPSSSSPDLAVFGVSAFDSLQTVPSALRTTLSAPTPDTPPRLSPLPGVQSETEALRDLIGDVETFLDDDATEPAFAEAGRRAGVIHLASHAFVHPSSPLQNAFLLHPDSTSDGLLFLHELQTRDRPIPLAVLSGCSTAQGTLRGGEGMAGLQYAFRAMGAQATVANLWPTADQSSVALMRSFYQRLQSGLPKDRALREAKLAYLENHPNQASPFFWGPSVLYGSPRPVPLDSSGGLFSWLWSPFGAGLLLALVAGGLWVLPYYEFS